MDGAFSIGNGQQRYRVESHGSPVQKLIAPPRIRRFSRGETICEPGLSNLVGCVVEGTIKLVSYLPDGHTSIVGVIEAPGFFGRVFDESAEFCVEAATDVVLACVERAAFETLLAERPELEHLIHMENLCQLDDAHERILVLACQNTMQRLATFMVLRLLTSEIRLGRPREAGLIHVPINRRDFASYLGTTVETVSRNLQALVRRGTITIIDSSNFRVLARNDLFRVASQDEDDLCDMIRSRRPAVRELSSLFARSAQERGQTAATAAMDTSAMAVAAE